MTFGPGVGRDRSPEDIANDIMNQSDEGLDGLSDTELGGESEDFELDDTDSDSSDFLDDPEEY